MEEYEDDLSKLGVIPSDRKRLENMGITTLDQIALNSVSTLGMGPSKGKKLIQRARNILANENIKEIDIKNDDLIEVEVKKKNRAVIKSILNSLGVYEAGWGNASLEKEGKTLKLKRETNKFDRILEKAEAMAEMIETKRIEEREKEGIFLPEDELKEFARKKGFDGFWKNVFQEIHGNETMKKVISTSMFSTYEEPVHSLIIGEPGSSKTMAKEIINEEFSDVTSVGSNTTRSGLVCNLGTGDLGVLPHSDRRIVLVDEFDKIPEEDVEYCYELLSNGKCSVHSAKFHKNIKSKFIMIAFANPKSKVFSKKAMSDIGLSPLLLSRCALVVRVKNITKKERVDLFKKKFYGGGDLREKHDYYDQWLKLARKYEPEIEASDKKIEKYIDDMNSIVEEYHDTQLRRDLRMGDYLRRVPRAIARASFSPINDEIISKSWEILKDSLETWR
ncbi:MAG: hypothetical protein V5A68_00385 [Candidatus Thermoplasmatota archaeon]